MAKQTKTIASWITKPAKQGKTTLISIKKGLIDTGIIDRDKKYRIIIEDV